MRISLPQLAAALDAVSESISKADSSFDDWLITGQDWPKGAAEWELQLAYDQLLVLCEVLEMPILRQELAAALNHATTDGLLASDSDPNGEPYLKHLSKPRRVRLALQSAFLTETSQTVTKDLEAIVREATYAITDTTTFGSLPANEESVHRRIEVILRCVFPDLLHKPRLTKPIKNFEPDTGIPSIATLIEYKFIANSERVPVTAEEVLADTRGYTSKEWQSFLYVIYETKRFKPETQWRQLLRESGVTSNTSIVVLTGEQPLGRRQRPRRGAA